MDAEEVLLFKQSEELIEAQLRGEAAWELAVRELQVHLSSMQDPMRHYTKLLYVLASLGAQYRARMEALQKLAAPQVAQQAEELARQRLKELYD